MKEFKYLIAKLKCKIKKGNNKESIHNLFRKEGMQIGEKCNICSNIITPESYLIHIGDNVTISNNVQLITHDNCVSKIDNTKTDIFGKIKIGSNSFIGARAIIMYGVNLPCQTIVAAGSVVTKSFYENGIIIAGNPAKIIGTWKDFEDRYSYKFLNADYMNTEEKRKKLNDSQYLIEK